MLMASWTISDPSLFLTSLNQAASMDMSGDHPWLETTPIPQPTGQAGQYSQEVYGKRNILGAHR
jgi:hypothetical protein